RLAAEKGHAESQYDLGFMLLLGEGGRKDTEEGVTWLERAGESGEYQAWRLLVDCYENGYCDVPVNPAKAALWRSPLEEYERLHPPTPSRQYSMQGSVDESSLQRISDIEGVIGCAFMATTGLCFVSYNAALITPAQLDEKIRSAGIPLVPAE